MLNTKVSICIPTYNQAKYLELAVRSAVEQTFKPHEIIVSNDCSTDKTSQILQQLSEEIPVLKIINQPQNLGIAHNVDFCLRSATGDFIIRLDSDDKLSPNYTEMLLALFDKFPEAGFAHCAIQEIDQSENLLSVRRLFRTTGYKLADEALYEARKGYKVAANVLMFKKKALLAVNYLNGRPDFGEDYHLTSSISAQGFGNIYLDEILAFYRVWIDTGKTRQKRKLAEINGIRHVFEDVLEPAYIKRNWNLIALDKSRERFACTQADCLSWNIYSSVEKEEIMTELYKLSATPIVKFVTYLYEKNLGGVFVLYNKLKSFPKSILKKYYKKLTN